MSEIDILQAEDKVNTYSRLFFLSKNEEGIVSLNIEAFPDKF